MKDRTKLPFGTPVVGVLGAGQLARMMYESAISLGIAFRVFANDEYESAAQVCADKTLGNLQDIEFVLKFNEFRIRITTYNFTFFIFNYINIH